MGDENALNLFQSAGVDNLLVGLVAPCTASFGAVFAFWLIVSSRAAYLHSMDELAELTSRIPFRGPAEEYGPGGLVDKNLENAIGWRARWGHASLQAVVEFGCVLRSRINNRGEGG